MSALKVKSRRVQEMCLCTRDLKNPAGNQDLTAMSHVSPANSLKPRAICLAIPYNKYKESWKKTRGSALESPKASTRGQKGLCWMLKNWWGKPGDDAQGQDEGQSLSHFWWRQRQNLKPKRSAIAFPKKSSQNENQQQWFLPRKINMKSSPVFLLYCS